MLIGLYREQAAKKSVQKLAFSKDFFFICIRPELMKAKLLIPISLLLFGCNKYKEQESEMVKKSMVFSMYARQDYSSAGYDHLYAQVHFELRKINFHTNKEELMWDTTFDARPLRMYPSHAHKLLIEKFVMANEGKDKFSLSASIIYNMNGVATQESTLIECVPGQLKRSIEAVL